MFLLVSVILFTGGSASVHAGIPPPLEAGTPSQGRRQTPPPTPGIRSMSGRYASYWNAFLFQIFLQEEIVNVIILASYRIWRVRRFAQCERSASEIVHNFIISDIALSKRVERQKCEALSALYDISTVLNFNRRRSGVRTKQKFTRLYLM